MRQSQQRKCLVIYRGRSLCAILLASLLLLSTPFSAGAAGRDDDDQTNTVNLTIRGGDAHALAACLNLAKEEIRDQKRGTRRWNDNDRSNGNWWDDRGRSDGNWWDDHGRSDGNWWDERGRSDGNWWDERGRSKDRERDDDGRAHEREREKRQVAQENDCDNKAVATGGDVILKNVDILTVQENKDGRKSAPAQSNTVNISIRGGDATALASCLNVVKDKGDSRVAQENDCDNKAVANGGNVFIKNVDITVIQKA
jgi:hypothetical protein